MLQFILDWIYGAEFDTRLFLVDLYALVTGKLKRIDRDYAGANSIKNAKRIALVAIYPDSQGSDFSTQHLLKGLQQNGFWTLVVSTRKLSELQKRQFSPSVSHFIERPSLGRDFGSYRVGLSWLKDKGLLQNAELLVLANDSLFYPSSFKNTVKQLLDQNYPWAGLFESFDFYYHSQSFFQIFKPEVFNSKAFHKFWRTYWPRSSRAHAISKGEIGLSKALLKAGFPQYSLYRADRIVSDIMRNKTKIALDPDLIFALQHTLKLPPMTEKQKLGYRGPTHIEPRDLNVFLDPKSDFAKRQMLQRNLAQNLSWLVENNNPTHKVGLLCNYLYEAPIKRDITYRGTIELATLLQNCRGFTVEEKQMMRDDLVKKGLPQSLKYSPRRMSLYRSNRI